MDYFLELRRRVVLLGGPALVRGVRGGVGREGGGMYRRGFPGMVLIVCGPHTQSARPPARAGAHGGVCSPHSRDQARTAGQASTHKACAYNPSLQWPPITSHQNLGSVALEQARASRSVPGRCHEPYRGPRSPGTSLQYPYSARQETQTRSCVRIVQGKPHS